MCLFDGDFHTQPLLSPPGLKHPHNGFDSIVQSRMQYQQSGFLETLPEYIRDMEKVLLFTSNLAGSFNLCKTQCETMK